MTTSAVYAVAETLRSAGLVFTLTAGNALAVSPAKRLTDEFRTLIRANKAALIELVQSAEDAANDPDEKQAVAPTGWLRPLFSRISIAELETFSERLRRIADRGVTRQETEAIAEKLLKRDRESDDRRLCLECAHMCGVSPSSWRCRNWLQARVAMSAHNAGLAGDFAKLLQRCDGFSNHPRSYRDGARR